MHAEHDIRRRWASLLLMGASGFACLGYQIVWTQQSALWLGHESAAVLAVVAAFFGGLSVGAFTLGARVERSTRPARWYAACEFAIAFWSLLVLLVMPPFSAWALRSTGVQPSPVWQWSVAFGGTFGLFLPATAAMGATLPAMERITARLRGDGQRIAALYASNTFGAVLGVLATAFGLVSRLGLAKTSVVCVALNFVCGAIALAVFGHEVAPASTVVERARSSTRGLQVRLALTGFLGIGYEVLIVRVLSQVSEDTVYTFALLLAVYLVGSAAGAAGYQRWLVTRREPENLSDSLLVLLSAACLVGTATLWGAGALREQAREVLGGGVAAAIVSEMVPAVVAFGPATLVMGALFSHFCRIAQASGMGFGRALGVNTLGAAAAPFFVGVMAAPTFGPKLALLCIAASYIALIARSSWKRPFAYIPATVAVSLALFAPALEFVEVPEGGRVVSYEDGVMAAVSVVEDARGVARLRIDNRAQEGSSATQRVDGRQAWLPLLLHSGPRRVLFLGLGTGITAASAADDPTLEVDAVELLPEVIRASEKFAPSLSDGKAHARLNLFAADARRYVRATERRYDVIVSDNFHPARSGSGSLYTVEHFEAVRLRLERGGVFCQWLPLHQLDRETLRSVVRSFTTTFPEVSALIASNSLETPVLGLVALRDAGHFDAARVRERLARSVRRERVTAIGLEDEFAVFGSFVAGSASLRRFAASADANTDDRPVVAYRAPGVTYAPDSHPGERLVALLRELSIEPSELVSEGMDKDWLRRLSAYFRARDRFIELGRGVRPRSRAEEMLAEVQRPLLSVLRISPDFRPAYDPLLSMATALARSDVSAAGTLLTALSRIQPARSEAPRLLTLMSSGSSVLDAPLR